MKKLLVILALCMVLTIALVACETPETPENPTDNVTTQKPTEAPTTNEPTTNEPTTNEPTTGEPTTGEPTDEPTTDEPTTEESTTEEQPPVVEVFEGRWHASVDSFMYCVNDDFSDVVAFTGANTNSTIGTTITNGAGETLASVTANYVYFAGGWLAADGYALENWVCNIYAADGSLLKTVALTTNVAEETLAGHITGNMGYSAETVAPRVGNDTEIISLKEFQGQNVTVVYAVDLVGTEFTVDLVKLDVTVPVDPAAPVFMYGANDLSPIVNGAPDIASGVVSEDGSYITITCSDTNQADGMDPWFTIRNIAKNAQFVAVKYRTTVAGSNGNFFLASEGSDATGDGDMSTPHSYEADGKWHIVVLDASTVSKINAEYLISFLRFDVYGNCAEGDTMDVAYIAGFNSAEYAEAYFAKTMLVADNTNTFASDVNANEVGTDLGVSDLANFFTLNLPTGGHLVEAYGEGKVYSMDNINEMLADVNGAYYVSVNILSGAVPSSVFVRGYHVVNSDAIIEAFDPNAGIYKINNYYETDGGTWCGGAGIYATITNGNLFIVLKAYDANVTTRVSNPAWMIPCEGTTLTIADNGYTVSLMVDGVTYATIDLIGAQSYADINDVSPAGQFVAKAIVTLKDGTTQTIENTLVAATVNSQVGVVARSGGTKFDSIVVGGYSAIEVPALEIVEPEPVDPNAPIFVATPEILANATTTGNQSTAVISEDGKFVTITAGEGSPVDANFWVLSPGSMITGVKYVGLKYRTTVNPGGEFFVGSTGITGGADEYKFEYVADGEWQVLILDITSFVNADGLVNYMRFDYFMAESVGCSIDIESIALFNSLESANKFYGIETPEEPEEPEEPEVLVIDPRTLPAGSITGHQPNIVDSTYAGHYPMIAAAGLQTGAMIHQGSIYLGEFNLQEYSKVIIYFATDWGEGTQTGLADAKANGYGYLGLTAYDCNNVVNPDRSGFVCEQYTPAGGWVITPHEIALGIEYSGPVYVSADFLGGQFIIIDRVEFVK